jgi:hypothetical protein
MLDGSEAAERLRDSLFSSGPAGLVSEAFGRGWRGQAGLDDAPHLRQWSGVEVCECRVGPRAFDPPCVWDTILSTTRIGESVSQP